MGAARFIGRVGGLAVALGAGIAIFGAAPLAQADDSGSADSTQDRGAARSTVDSVPKGRGGATIARLRAESGKPASEAGLSVGSLKSFPRPSEVPREIVGRQGRILRNSQLDPQGAAEVMQDSRFPGAASSIGPSAVAQAGSSAVAAGGQISTDPNVVWADGILRGTVGAVSAAGRPLTYTVLSGPSLGGKLSLAPVTEASPEGEFSYLPYSSTLTTSTQNEQFTILVAETTAFTDFLSNLPILGLVFSPALSFLHRLPLVSELLAPIIGASTIVEFDENPYGLVAARPVAFTYLMPSFDGTPISVNYFPAVDVATGAVASAPTVLNGPGLFDSGNIDPDSIIQDIAGRTPGLLPLRTDTTPGGYDGGGGYNVITWDPRGRYASGGVLQMDNPFWEGRDASSIISWAIGASNPARNQVAMESEDDPLLGMVGASYGGGIQLVTAGTPDRRIDALVPSIAWNSFPDSLYPNSAFKTAYSALLLLGMVARGARINSQIYEGMATGFLFGYLSPSSVAMFAASGPTILVDNIDIPTQYIQGTSDGLFPFQQAIANIQQMATAQPSVPVKMSWVCGGHGPCLDPMDPNQDELILSNNLKWLDQYVAGNGTPADSIPEFQWFDQKGVRYTSDLMPFEAGFNNPAPLSFDGDGGRLGLAPIIGGSGPSTGPFPFSLTQGAEARNAVNVDIPLAVGSQVAGTPSLSFTYSGLGTSRFVYAQLVDNATGRVLGGMVTAVPVTLDGRQHTVEIPLEAIAYTAYETSDSLTLQITSSATAYENFTAFGLIDIANINLSLPTVDRAES